jgi:hypothetical protein
VAGGVVENVGLGEVVHPVFRADGDGGGEFAAAEAIEEEKSRDVAADRFGVKSGERGKAAVDLFEAGDAVGGELEGFDSFEKMIVGVTFPSGAYTRVKCPPRFMVFLRIKFVSLCDIKLATCTRFFDKRRVSGGESLGRQDLGHASLLCFHHTAIKNNFQVVLCEKIALSTRVLL